MAAKRALKAVEEAKEAKANELIRRKAGKVCAHSTSASFFFCLTSSQDMNQIREEIQARESKKEAEAIKRGARDHNSASHSYI